MSKLKKIMEGDGFISVTEAARLVGVHATTIYRQLDERLLAGQKVGGRRFVSLESLKLRYSAPSIQKRIVGLEERR